MADTLILEVAEFEVDVLTGIYSEETGKPQPLRITIQAALKPAPRYEPTRRSWRRARITWT
jgi:dihydroneopterin aldolase